MVDLGFTQMPMFAYKSSVKIVLIMQILLTFAANVCKDVAVTIQSVNLLSITSKKLSHTKNLAAFTARFLKCV